MEFLFSGGFFGNFLKPKQRYYLKTKQLLRFHLSQDIFPDWEENLCLQSYLTEL